MKYLSILRYALIGIGVLIVVLVFAGAFDVQNWVLDPKEGGVALMLDWAYILLGIAVATAVLMPLIGIVQDPKKALRSLIGLGAVAVVFIIAYILSSDAPIQLSGSITATPAELKITDTGLYVAYILLAVALASIVLGEVYRLFKR